MKYRIVKRPSDQMYYVQTSSSQDEYPIWKDYDGDLGDVSLDYECVLLYRDGFFSLREAKKALKRIRQQADWDSRPDEVVWEEDD